MNINEAYAKKRITDEEIEAIKRYMGFSHTRINLLSNFSPEAYEELKKMSWEMPETEEDIKKDIQDFVKIYSAMYKNSRKQQYRRKLVRGTSNKRMEQIVSTIPQMLSTTTSEEIAKTFVSYGDAAIAYFDVGKQVPFLEAEAYRDENSRNEHEVILAPFCKAVVRRGNRAREEYGFSNYQVTVEKPELEEKTEEEIEELQEEVLKRFTQNLQDIKELPNLEYRMENLERRYKQAGEDEEEKEYLKETRKETKEKLEKVIHRTYEFKYKLRTLLKGMCRQKEKEIDEAVQVIEEEEQKLREERKKQQEEEKAKQEKQAKEEERKKKISELTEKKQQSPQNIKRLQEIVISAYEEFMTDESKIKEMAEKFGFPYEGEDRNHSISEIVEKIKNNMQTITEKIAQTELSNEMGTEEAQAELKKIAPLCDGVEYGIEITSSFPSIQEIHKKQIEKKIKRGIYRKVQEVIKKAKIEKYSEEKTEIQEEKIGFFGRIFGKEKLRQAKLENLELKMQLAKDRECENPEIYSIRKMLVDIYMCAESELKGKMTEEMRAVYNVIKANFRDSKTGEFTEEYIRNIAGEEILGKQKAGKLTVKEKKSRFFGRTNAQIKILQGENAKLKRDILVQRTNRSTFANNIQEESDAAALLEQRLKGIANNTEEREKSEKQLEDTFQLW